MEDSLRGIGEPIKYDVFGAASTHICATHHALNDNVANNFFFKRKSNNWLKMHGQPMRRHRFEVGIGRIALRKKRVEQVVMFICGQSGNGMSFTNKVMRLREQKLLGSKSTKIVDSKI